MTKKVMFDTLHYAKLLKKGGVRQSNVHSAALADVITQNMYTKAEVGNVLETKFKKSDEKFYLALKEFAERTQQNREEYKELSKKREIEMLELENRIEKAFNRHMYTIISILGSLIVIVGAIATFAHAFFR